jgi:Rrf2 family protein
MQVLSRTGLIRSQRGVRGGFSLSRLPQSLTLREIIQAFGPLPRIIGCPLGILSHNTHLCPLHRRLDNALAMMEQTLQTTTVADLLQGKPPQSCCSRCQSAEPAVERDGKIAENHSEM